MLNTTANLEHYQPGRNQRCGARRDSVGGALVQEGSGVKSEAEAFCSRHFVQVEQLQQELAEAQPVKDEVAEERRSKMAGLRSSQPFIRSWRQGWPRRVRR